MSYAELHCISNFTFLRGASRPEELVNTACELGYQAIAITDECSLAGVVKAHVKAKQLEKEGRHIKLIIGSEFKLPDSSTLIALATNKSRYQELSAFITLCRKRSIKGEYQLLLNDLNIHLEHCLLIYVPGANKNPLTSPNTSQDVQLLLSHHENLWVGYQRLYQHDDESRYQKAYQLATTMNKPMVACGNVHMHCHKRKPLQDTLTAIKKNTALSLLGNQLFSNSENYLRPLDKLKKIYPPALLNETLNIADRCHFSLEELRYEYPHELVPPNLKADQYLLQLVTQGANKRWNNQVPEKIQQQIKRELTLIKELNYEYFFLTVHDIVCFARQENILCQGRGSAANSVVCYCLFITEVDPSRIAVLFERFISKERNEPPDIDVDFEHERREEVIQYIYKKYSRERAALAATVISYRSRSAIRDVGKALGLNTQITEKLSRSLGWWDKPDELQQQFYKCGLDADINHPNLTHAYQSGKTHDNHASIATLFMQLVHEIMGFPRHLSQHVGGFIISNGPLSRLVPIENASMPERTVIQWDKDDIEALGLLKVDILALGMLSAIQKMLALANNYPLKNTPNNSSTPPPITLASIPDGDRATYDMLCNADSIGVFQVESRAQIAMLPRLKPRVFYDLVIQIALVRPGPIQGEMVHPFLRRREKREPVSYENEAIRTVLERTLGVPIFQEQVIKLAMVAAGFSGGEADQLRRAMASWGKNGTLWQFREKLLDGMLSRNYSKDFAERIFEQMKGFGSYGFPESHAASFALLVYVSAWLKCHYPAAFYAALINSQPMGFYSPSQLIQDAQRHHIDILPIDVQLSDWDCSLHFSSTHKPLSQPALRLGLRLVKGLSMATGKRIEAARAMHSFRHLADVIERAQLNQSDRLALIRADATASLSGHRHQSHWQNLAADAEPIMYERTNANNNKTNQDNNRSKASLAANTHDTRQDLNDNITLSEPSEIQDIQADYRHTGLTLRRHPMALLREHPPFSRCKRCIDLNLLQHKRFVVIAGIVTGRQQPGTASGVIFLTLEDETGNINVIVWKNRQEQYREELLKSKLLLIKGVVERNASVIHIIAGQLVDCSNALQGLLLPSRDFH